MGNENSFAPVKFFCGVIYRKEDRYLQAKEVMQDLFSASDAESDAMPFVLTDYYNAEMGTPLFRRFVSFRRWIDPQRLTDIKRVTNRLERESSVDGKRTVNLDPGFLSPANVIIATTKNHYHRIPLRDGIYAHLEYIIKNRRITPLEWTYPDFRTGEYIAFFDRLRLSCEKGSNEISG